MATKRGYHHGDLREALVGAAQAVVETGGPEALSLRDLTQALGVSSAAPYRHFADRRSLLAEVAARGFADLDAAYGRAQAEAATPMAALRETARAYLTLAFGRPGLFRLMFGSDILGPDSTLMQGGRLRGFMTEPLTEAELLEAILDKTLHEA